MWLSRPVQLLADGEPLVAGQAEWRSADIASYAAPTGLRPGVAGQVVVGGRLRELDGTPLRDRLEPDRSRCSARPGPIPVGSCWRSWSPVQTGHPQLRVGPAGGELAVAPLDAVTMTRPTWRTSGTEVWTVIDGRTVVGVALSGAGPPLTYPVDATELTRLGPISQLRLSRDGVRVAAVIGGRLGGGRGGARVGHDDPSPSAGVASRQPAAHRRRGLGRVLSFWWWHPPAPPPRCPRCPWTD